MAFLGPLVQLSSQICLSSLNAMALRKAHFVHTTGHQKPDGRQQAVDRVYLANALRFTHTTLFLVVCHTLVRPMLTRLSNLKRRVLLRLSIRLTNDGAPSR